MRSQLETWDEPKSTDPAAILFDLENLSYAAGALPCLADVCSASGTELRVYSSSASPLAIHATHKVDSNLPDAADLRITWDSALLSHGVETGGVGARVLVLTRDHFGSTLASIDHRVETAHPEKPLAPFWRDRLGGAGSVAEVLAAQSILKQSVSLGILASRSWETQAKNSVSLLMEMAQGRLVIGLLFDETVQSGDGTHEPTFECTCSARLLLEAPVIDATDRHLEIDSVVASLRNALMENGSDKAAADACTADLMACLAKLLAPVRSERGQSLTSDADPLAQALVGLLSGQLVARGQGGSKRAAKNAAAVRMLELLHEHQHTA